MERNCFQGEGGTQQRNCDHESSYSRMANVLGDMISYRPPPLTVGVFGKWGTGKSRMLKLVRDRIEHVTFSRSQKPNVFSISFFKLIFRLLFFNPNLKVPKSKDTKFIFVDFSILDYAGTDQLWAGVITHISSIIEEVFGSWSVRVFRAWHYKPDKDLQMYLEPSEEATGKKCSKRWTISKTSVFVVSALIAIVILVVVLWSIYGFPQLPAAEGDVLTTVITTSVAAMLGLGVASKIGDIFKMLFNLIKTQADKVKAMANETNFSTNLGFMYKVKTEIHYITSLVRYAGHFLEKDFRLCLIIDDIDILTSDKVMGLFQVVSLLECSPNSPYVQILCMDPYIAASVVKKSLNSELKNGHAYLRKHIELPFHIPSLDQKNKLRFLLSKGAVKHFAGLESPEVTPRHKDKRADESIPLVKVVQQRPQLATQTICLESDYKRTWDEVRKCFEEKPNLLDYIDGNELRVQRILSSTQLAIRLTESVHQKDIKLDIEKLASWIILADQWPYRLSCIWQAIDDNSQLYEIDPSIAYKFSAESLLQDLYPLIVNDLKAVKGWKEFLELDADPEMFAQFLLRFPLTVGDLKTFLPYTTNLDRSLRRIVASAIVKNRLDNKPKLQGHIKRWRHKKPLDKWTVDDVCGEFEKIGLNDKNLGQYMEIITSHDIDGKTLRRAAPSDIKKQLKMSLGDWVAAKEHFAALRTFYGERRKSFGPAEDLNGVVGVSRNELLSTSLEEYCSEDLSSKDDF